MRPIAPKLTVFGLALVAITSFNAVEFIEGFSTIAKKPFRESTLSINDNSFREFHVTQCNNQRIGMFHKRLMPIHKRNSKIVMRKPSSLFFHHTETVFSTYFPPLSSRGSRNDSTTSSALSCQLLGMNCATPTDFTFSFTGFARRGGDTDKHSDGWGLAFYEGRGIRAFHDRMPAASSPIAEFLSKFPIKTLNMMSHIRYATSGEVCLENVHPFQREMWGIQWCFAHNGDVPIFSKSRRKEHPWLGDSQNKEKIYNPVGDTDSEAVFCAVLNALRAKFDTLPTLAVLYDTLNSICQEIVSYDPDTIFNFLFMCGEHILFAYSWPGARPNSKIWNGLHYTIREPPFSKAQLLDCDVSVDFSAVTSDRDRVAVIATTPLTTNEDWTEFKKGELILFDQGLPYRGAEDCLKVEVIGHGLKSEVLPPSIYMGSMI